jgi:hypothetical protein
LKGTREEFRAFALGIDRTTESGEAFYQLLMSLAGPFASLVPAIESTTTAIQTATTAISEYGYTVVSVGDIAQAVWEAEQRRLEQLKKEKDALDAAGKSIHDFIMTLTGARAGTATPEQTLNAARAAYEADLIRARAGDTEASSRLAQEAQAYIDAQKALTGSGTPTQVLIDKILEELATLPATRSYEAESLRIQTAQLEAMELIARAMAGPSMSAVSTNGANYAGGDAGAVVAELSALRNETRELLDQLIGVSAEGHRKNLDNQQVLIRNTEQPDGVRLRAVEAPI